MFNSNVVKQINEEMSKIVDEYNDSSHFSLSDSLNKTVELQSKMIEQQARLIEITRKNSNISTIIAITSLIVAIASCLIPLFTFLE